MSERTVAELRRALDDMETKLTLNSERDDRDELMSEVAELRRALDAVEFTVETKVTLNDVAWFAVLCGNIVLLLLIAGGADGSMDEMGWFAKASRWPLSTALIMFMFILLWRTAVGRVRVGVILQALFLGGVLYSVFWP